MLKKTIIAATAALAIGSFATPALAFHGHFGHGGGHFGHGGFGWGPAVGLGLGLGLAAPYYGGYGYGYDDYGGPGCYRHMTPWGWRVVCD
jgi:hypothetical protein